MFMQPPPGASGGFIPPIKYNAISGRLTLEDREQAVSGEWEKKITDITMSQPTFAVDFGNLNVGWVLFIQGIAPQYALVPYGQPMPERPASPGNDVAGKALNYRNGFRVPVAGNAIGGVREMAGQSAALINGMNELHSAYEAAPEAAMGKIPVVKMIRTDADQPAQINELPAGVSDCRLGGSAGRTGPAHRSGASRTGSRGSACRSACREWTPRLHTSATGATTGAKPAHGGRDAVLTTP